ncbi:alpha/beta hydrolase [Streptococcus didelphis]|uniref:Alpha/beta hydrolase n=1 Tax=Streptococcus didelphis TaxID=102886 RepID=A0ABY9LG00_9STRE|nr:alpha/beta hydrolase [Streptococcus didelphis]WMB27827.1 alpha/beta hydrolase [Streptococcus didelphis]WMB29711.1 alpha/beta hydrolase [Streptococcus didelphis]
MIKKRYWFLFGLTLIAFIFLSILGKNYVNKVSNQQKALVRSQMEPSIFVPGSSATKERFNDMLSALNSVHRKYSILKVVVSKTDKLIYSGNITSNDNHPFIVIAFENNQDGYDNIKKQAKWLSLAMTDLQKQYHFKRFNAIGHSNGGLNWTLFLEKYYSSENFHIEKLITIGTPYNFEESNPSNRTQMLKDLIDDHEAIPSSLLVYNLAGTDSYEDDKIVPFASVETGKFIFQKVVKHYTQVTVTGIDASHSDLPSNPEVIQYVAEKILSVGRPK